MTEREVTVDQFPAVDAAYAFVLPSYQMLAMRFEAADTRLTTLLTLTVSLTLGAPVFARALRPDIVFSALPFIGALILAIIAVLIGIVSRVSGALVLPDPMVIYEKSLHRSDHSFKLAQIYFAGENLRLNRMSVEAKGKAAFAMMLAVCLETSLLIWWLTT